MKSRCDAILLRYGVIGYSAYIRQGPSVSPKRIREVPVFDVNSFLDAAGLGRKIGKFRRKETVFAQGDAAKNVMYIQKAV